MVGAALNLSNAVKTAGGHTFPSLTDEMAGYINQSYPLSAVMARYPQYFSDYEVAAVATGENNGSLDVQLAQMANEMEKAYSIRQGLLSKLFYPALVAHCAVFIPPLVVLVTKGMGPYLHMTLGILIPVYIVLFCLFAGYKLSSQSSVFRGAVDTLIYYTPVLGSTVRLMALTRFLRVLSHLHEAGVLPDKALMIAAETCGNRHVTSLVKGSFNRLGDTVRTSKIMASTGVFPKMAVQMMATGEETGTTGAMLNKVADVTEQDMNVSMHRIVTVLPVLMLLAVGALVGYQVVGTFADLYKGITF